MSGNGKDTKNAVTKLNEKSTRGALVVTHSEGLQVLSKLSEVEDSTPESSLIAQAQRLNNVAHSFIEEREKKYLNDDMESLTTSPSDFSIDAVCKLSEQARENIKLAMEIKRGKVQDFKTIMNAMNGIK